MSDGKKLSTGGEQLTAFEVYREQVVWCFTLDMLMRLYLPGVLGVVGDPQGEAEGNFW